MLRHSHFESRAEKMRTRLVSLLSPSKAELRIQARCVVGALGLMLKSEARKSSPREVVCRLAEGSLVMLKHFTSLGLLGLLILGCSSKSGTEGGAVGGNSAYNPGVGGTGNGGAAGSAGSTSLIGGISDLTQSISDAINNSACAGADAELEVNPALLEFIVDVSGSMADHPIGSADQTKWDITKTALTDAILNGLPDTTGVGMLLFPNMNTVVNHNHEQNPVIALPIETCVNVAAAVPVAPLGPTGSEQRTKVKAALENALVAGGTPTDDAFEYAYGMGLMPGKSKYTYYAPFMVLITDGQPTIQLTCAGTGSTQNPVDWHPITEFIQKIFSPTDPAVPVTKTFIVGSPGSDAQSTTGADGRPWLSMAARLGGTPRSSDCNDDGQPEYCHFDMSQSTNFAADLSDALKAIIKAAIPCSVKIPAPSGGLTPDPAKINVVYKQNVVNDVAEKQYLIGQTADPTCAGNIDGWYIDPADSTKSTIVLCPTTCKAVQTDKYAKLYVRQGCATIVGIQ